MSDIVYISFLSLVVLTWLIGFFSDSLWGRSIVFITVYVLKDAICVMYIA